MENSVMLKEIVILCLIWLILMKSYFISLPRLASNSIIHISKTIGLTAKVLGLLRWQMEV